MLAVIATGIVLSVILVSQPSLRQAALPAIRQTPDQNVLLVTLDTLRGDALGCYGGRASTPNLDRLASLGVRFDFAHAHGVITLPAHASILTGLYPFQHAVHDNAGFRLAQSIPTLATTLRAHGVATAAIISSFALDSRFGLNSGFEVYDERYGRSQTSSGFEMAERRGDVSVEVATDWISRQRGRWFAWVHLFDPHAPYDPPSPYREQYADQPYFGEVAFTDSVLARLFDAARDLSGRPTLVIVTGDHGEGLGDHGEMTHGLFAYEPTLRVPLIIAQIGPRTAPWAGSTTGGAPDTRGRVSSVTVRHVDIVPTVLDALKLTIPANLPGLSLLSATSRADGGTASYFESMSASFNRGWAPLTGVLVDREKYIELPLPERYDLGKDPGEQTNLVNQDPARTRELEARLEAFGAVRPGLRQAEDPEAAARLRALGYIAGNAPAKARYTEEDDPKRLVALDQALRRAVDLYERKRPREAIPIYQEVIARRPGMEVTYSHLAMLYWDLGEPQAAIATLRRARQQGADSVALRTKLGMYLAEAGAVDEAVPLLREAASGTFPDLDALNALGIALAKARRIPEAEATFDRILQLSPSNTMALENLATIALQQGQMDKARGFLMRALEGDPASAQAHNSLGVIEMKSGNRKAAIEHWRQAVAGDASNFDALYNLGTELVKDGRREEARPYLERFVRSAPPAFYAKDIAHVRGLLGK